jgi:hypothetical protein
LRLPRKAGSRLSENISMGATGMNRIGSIVLGLAAAVSIAVPAPAQCTHCVIQTKVPSTSSPGKFDYRVSCIVDLSGDEVNTVVTAGSDEEAIEAVRQKKC